jgi:hypothetical protein
MSFACFARLKSRYAANGQALGPAPTKGQAYLAPTVLKWCFGIQPIT